MARGGFLLVRQERSSLGLCKSARRRSCLTLQTWADPLAERSQLLPKTRPERRGSGATGRSSGALEMNGSQSSKEEIDVGRFGRA